MVAQRIVFYEEDPNDQQGRRYVGSAIWRTETVSPASGFEPEPALRADVEIPERRMTVTWSLRRNTDKALAASHTIEITFNLPADFPGGGIANVPGILMKQAEQARGTPLSGLAVKVTNGFFLIGLSAVDTDVQHNVQLLKERSWFDIPIVYANGGRAIPAMEKAHPETVRSPASSPPGRRSKPVGRSVGAVAAPQGWSCSSPIGKPCRPLFLGLSPWGKSALRNLELIGSLG